MLNNDQEIIGIKVGMPQDPVQLFIVSLVRHQLNLLSVRTTRPAQPQAQFTKVALTRLDIRKYGIQIQAAITSTTVRVTC